MPITRKIQDITRDDLKKHDNTSKKIRFLSSMGYPVGDIERIFERLGVTTRAGTHIRYQHIRNVLHTVLSDAVANDNVKRK